MRRGWGRFARKSTPSAHRTGPFRPTTALQTPKAGVPASPWMWAKATTNLGAVIRMCGDGMVVSNEARMGSIYLHGNNPPLLHIYRTGPFRPTTALQIPKAGVPASPWMWAQATTNLGAVIRLYGDGVVSNEARMGSICMEIIHPFCTYYTEPDPSDPPPHSRYPKLVFPPRHGCGQRHNQSRCSDSPVRRRGGVE